MILQLYAGRSEHYTNGPSQIWDELRRVEYVSYTILLANQKKQHASASIAKDRKRQKNDRNFHGSGRISKVRSPASQSSAPSCSEDFTWAMGSSHSGHPCKSSENFHVWKNLNMLFWIVKMQDCHTSTFSEWKVIERTAQPVLHTLHGNLRTQCQNIFAVYTC